MNVLLTGATGYIGSAVVEALQQSGHQVTGLARSDQAMNKLKARGIRMHKGDLLDVMTIEHAAREAEGVIHAGATNDANMAEADTSAVRAILAALRGTGKPFIYTSGVWVMGNTGDQVADESKPLDPTPVIAWRASLEGEIAKAAKQGIRAIIIRPADVYGHGGGLLAMFVQSAREHGTARYIGTGENRWPFVHVDDLADLYVRALEKAPPGTLVIGAHGPSFRVHELAEAASLGAGAHGRTEAWALEEARTQMGPLADALVLDQQVSGDKAKRLLGWVPTAPSVLEDLKHGSYANISAGIRPAP